VSHPVLWAQIWWILGPSEQHGQVRRTSREAKPETLSCPAS